MEDYGEPWVFVECDDVGDMTIERKDFVVCRSNYRKGTHPCVPREEAWERAVACVNALQGIPTDQLGEVKKAWLAWGLSRSTSEHTFNYAVQRRKEGRDYGELNALIDSVKE